MVGQVVRRIAERIFAEAPDGWSGAVALCQVAEYGASMSGGYQGLGEGDRRHHRAGLLSEFETLAQAIQGTADRVPLMMEVVCGPSGHYALVAATGPISEVPSFMGGGFEVVLDSGHRFVPSGFRQEAGTAPPAGDPELAARRLRDYLARRTAILGRPEQLSPAASPVAIEEAEHRLGFPLPADLKAMYLVTDGEDPQGPDRCLFANASWLSLESLVREHLEQTVPHCADPDADWDEVFLHADPPHTVRRCVAHPGWVTFAMTNDGDALAVDLAPARDGRPGQVIRHGPDLDYPIYVADSVTSLLGGYLDRLEQGAYHAHDTGRRSSLELWEDIDEEKVPSTVTGTIPNPVTPGLQAVHINDHAGLVDLTPLAAATNLLRLRMNRGATADLTPIGELPVEDLRLTVDGADLTPLAGHPALASLDLGSTGRTDLTPLRTIPNLHGLDLSRADARDLTILSSLPGLRYLALTSQQWAHLRETGSTPTTLAVARLADKDATLTHALTWAVSLGFDPEPVNELTGNLHT